MKYTKIDFDFNRPTRKSLTIPLDSEYGIGIRAVKDGQVIEDTDIQVTGLSACGNHAGYEEFVIQSGSKPSNKILDVEISKGGNQDVGSLRFGLTTISIPNRQLEPNFSTAGKQLSAVTEWLGDEIELSPTQLVCDLELSCCLTDGTVLSTFSMPSTYKYSLNNGLTEYSNIDGEHWEDNQGNVFDKIEIFDWNYAIVRTKTGLDWGTYDVMRTCYCDMTLKFRQGGSESLSAKFQIGVSEADLGYIEVGK